MSYTIEQMSAWQEMPHKYLLLSRMLKDGSLVSTESKWKTFSKMWRALPRDNWPGVYCAWSGETLLYIGYSQHVFKRVAMYNIGDFNPNYSTSRLTRFTALQCASPDEAASLEAQLISLHRPPNNRRIEPKGGQVRRRKRAA